jgi:cbb3-type cytochrome oxidase subunit 3
MARPVASRIRFLFLFLVGVLLLISFGILLNLSRIGLIEEEDLIALGLIAFGGISFVYLSHRLRTRWRKEEEAMLELAEEAPKSELEQSLPASEDPRLYSKT